MTRASNSSLVPYSPVKSHVVKTTVSSFVPSYKYQCLNIWLFPELWAVCRVNFPGIPGSRHWLETDFLCGFLILQNVTVVDSVYIYKDQLFY